MAECLWGEPRREDSSSQYVLPIRLAIPLRHVVLLPIGTGHHEARLRLFVGAVSENGQTSKIDDAPIGLRLADEHVEAAKSESILHTHKLLLRSGRQKIGVAVLDVFGNQSAVVTGFLDVGGRVEADSR